MKRIYTWADILATNYFVTSNIGVIGHVGVTQDINLTGMLQNTHMLWLRQGDLNTVMLFVFVKAVMNTLSVPSLVSPTPPDTTPVKEKDPDKEVGSPVKKEDTEAEADAKKVEDCFPAICCVK